MKHLDQLTEQVNERHHEETREQIDKLYRGVSGSGQLPCLPGCPTKDG
jgi:hypothetical protein